MLNFLFKNSLMTFLTQSVWRDEAYSILIAQKPISTYFHVSFEPPLYYILLHYWIKIFGTSEIAARSLSLLGFFVAILCIIIWAKKLFRTSWLSWFVPLIFLLNPMLLYYAFEARAYGWYTAFTVLSCYFYFEKKWSWYTVTTILALYTHTYSIFVPLIQVIHYLSFYLHRSKFHFQSIWKDPFFRSICLIIAFYTPWIIKIISDIPRLQKSWYFPVDLQLVKSVLGNIFLGYEGTPWFLWTFMKLVSIIIFGISLFSITRSKDKIRNSFFFLLLYVPLSIILIISIIKPLYVLRYMIPSTIAEVFLISFALDSISRPFVQKISAVCIVVFFFGFTIWFTPYHLKLPIRNTLTQINSLQQKQDVILVDDARILYETIYYNTSPSHVYWYNPNGDIFPWYIGDFIVQPFQIVRELPPYPMRAFLIHLDGTYEITYNSPMTIIPKIQIQKK